MKCKHPTVWLGETTPHLKVHTFEEGRYVESCDGDYGDIEDVYHVTCSACGLSKDYNVYQKSCPKWVRALVAQLTPDAVSVK